MGLRELTFISMDLSQSNTPGRGDIPLGRILEDGILHDSRQGQHDVLIYKSALLCVLIGPVSGIPARDGSCCRFPHCVFPCSFIQYRHHHIFPSYPGNYDV
jgi:hypothetical protein